MIKEKISLKVSKQCATSQTLFRSHFFISDKFRVFNGSLFNSATFFLRCCFHTLRLKFLLWHPWLKYLQQKITIYFFSALCLRLIFDVVRFSFDFIKIFFHLHDIERRKEKAKRGEVPPMRKKSLSSIPHFHTWRLRHFIFSIILWNKSCTSLKFPH